MQQQQQQQQQKGSIPWNAQHGYSPRHHHSSPRQQHSPRYQSPRYPRQQNNTTPRNAFQDQSRLKHVWLWYLLS